MLHLSTRALISAYEERSFSLARICGMLLSLGVLLLVLLISGCMATEYTHLDLDDYEGALRGLRADLMENPQDAGALRDLGIIYLRGGYPARGLEYLEQAHDVDPNDPQTLFSMGLANERLGRSRTALRIYGRYADVPQSSRYHRLMHGRYGWLAQDVAREEVRRALVQEASLELQPGPGNVVAVFPLSYSGEEERYAVLSLGLAEMIMVDLASVDALRVVERARLDALLDELELAESDFMDSATTPRSGRLLGAGRVVGGSYDVMGGEDMRLDAGVWALSGEEVPQLDSHDGLLRNLFALQKQAVDALLVRMGIQPTEEERRRLRRVPTDNLDAFLAFSRGLTLERQQRYEEAAEAFGEAAALDPDFELAASRQARAESISTATGSIDTFMQDTGGLDDITQQFGSYRINDRLRHLNQVLGIGIVPTDETRSGASESANEAARLRDPPPPPNN